MKENKHAIGSSEARRMTGVLRVILIAVILLAAAACFFTACAEVSATPNQRLALRACANNDSVWLGHMPQSTKITAYEYEKGNGVTWVLVEYKDGGKIYRGYTGLKRMKVNGSIPWADHYDETVRIRNGGKVWAAPNVKAGYRGNVNSGERVTLLDFENGYAYIEFYDGTNAATSRGYVSIAMIEYEEETEEGGNGVPATPNQRLALRACANNDSVWLGHMPQSTKITAYEYEKGNGVTWVLVEYEYEGMRCRGYTGLKRMKVNGDIPWADHLYDTAYTARACTVLAAPSQDGYYRAHLDRNDEVTILEYEDGYAYVEFDDAEEGAVSRGYVPESALY